MSNALLNAAESTVHAVSGAVSDAFSDLVEGARDRIEDLPLGRTKHTSHGKRWTLMIVVAMLGMLAIVAKRRGNNTPTSASTESTGAKIAEKTLAVS